MIVKHPCTQGIFSLVTAKQINISLRGSTKLLRSVGSTLLYHSLVIALQFAEQLGARMCVEAAGVRQKNIYLIKLLLTRALPAPKDTVKPAMIYSNCSLLTE